jgi:hypothetical protein
MRFENAANLVGLDPDDCIPIPAYKAYDAIEKKPNLLYAICIDYTLLTKIKKNIFSHFSPDESFVWEILSNYAGTSVRDAEDRFVYSIVNRHWEQFSQHVPCPVFHIISARKAIQ